MMGPPAGPSYSHAEWTNSSLHRIQEADTCRLAAEAVRGEAGLLIEDRVNRALVGQRGATELLGERVRELRELRAELARELEASGEEAAALVEARRRLEFCLGQCKRPLAVTRKCLAAREARVGIDQVADRVQRGLARERACVEGLRHRMAVLLQLVGLQQGESQARQQQLREDIGQKEAAEEIDQRCHVLQERRGAARAQEGAGADEPEGSTPACWAAASRSTMHGSAQDRELSQVLLLIPIMFLLLPLLDLLILLILLLSQVLRTDIEELLAEAEKEILSHWNATNRDLKERVSETADMQKKLEQQLPRLDQEILETDCLADQLRRARAAKQAIATRESPSLPPSRRRCSWRRHGWRSGGGGRGPRPAGTARTTGSCRRSGGWGA
jgi:hypothetical protein